MRQPPTAVALWLLIWALGNSQAIAAQRSDQSAAASRQTTAQAAPEIAVDRQVVVTLAPDTDGSEERTRKQVAADHGLDTLYAWPLRSLGLHCVVFAIPESKEADVVVAALRADPRIESAQRVQEFSLQQTVYNDPHFSLQHGLQSWKIERLHGWATGAGIRVAVVDTGVDRDHPDLADRLGQDRTFVRRTLATPGFHGTAVAGVIAASANNDLGVVGVAPEAEIVSLGACSEIGPTGPGRCDTFALAKALDFAVVERVDILNLSFAGPEDRLLGRLLNRADAEGIAVIAAVDESGEALPFPASLHPVIAVRSAPFDDSGASVVDAPQDLAAPGIDILTTVPGGRYDFVSGSSFAAAHVSGAAALLLQRRPELSPEDLKRLLHITGRFGAVDGTEALGGIPTVDPCAALTRMLGEAVCPPAAEVATSQR